MNIVDPQAPADEEVIVVPRKVARSTAAQLCGVKIAYVQLKHKRGIFKIVVNPPGAGRVWTFRGGSWFFALQQLHGYLVQKAALAGPEPDPQEDTKS